MARWLWLSVAVLALDQISKYAAETLLLLHRPVPVLPPVLDFMLAYNTGAAFSFLAGAGGWQRWFFIVLAGAVSVALTVWIVRLHAHERRLAVALALVLGGAVGKLVDRALWGHVIDFILVHFGDWPFPAFNLADSAITVGAALLVLDSLFPHRAPDA